MTKMWEKFGNNKNTIWQIVSQKGLGGIMKVSGRAKVLNYLIIAVIIGLSGYIKSARKG